MISQVYYRKWRPGKFSDLVGQEHVSSTLRNAIIQNRIAHSYLFSGPRGTGKTTTARILAKVLNCAEPANGEPDGVCPNCMNIEHGRALDIIEMDAASNRGIDEIRSIREKINLAPVEGSYKVYIIDEAHMLTEAASNAFLKTLEEPPPHAIFVLCTTEPHKILTTLVSRCQRFDFHRLSTESIVERLSLICNKEHLEPEPSVLNAVATAAKGSLRDAENILEQLAITHGAKLELNKINKLLGLEYIQEIIQFTTHLLLGNTQSALTTIGLALKESADLRRIHHQTLELLKGLLMIKSGVEDVVDLPREAINELKTLANEVPINQIMKCIKTLAEPYFTSEASPTFSLELAVVEMSLDKDISPIYDSETEKLPKPDDVPSIPEYQHSEVNVPPIVSDQERKDVSTAFTEEPRKEQFHTNNGLESGKSTKISGKNVIEDDSWDSLIKSLSQHKGKRFNMGALLRDCMTPRLEDKSIIFPFNHQSHLERMQGELEESSSLDALESAIQDILGTRYEINLILNTSDKPINSNNLPNDSAVVKAALDMGGRILEKRRLNE